MDQNILSRQKAQKIAGDFINYLIKKYRLPVEGAYLFGSYAKGHPRRDSDIDVCIISKKFKDIDPLIYLWRLRRNQDVKYGIEPMGLHPDDFVEENPIAYEVKRNNIVLK